MSCLVRLGRLGLLLLVVCGGALPGLLRGLLPGFLCFLLLGCVAVVGGDSGGCDQVFASMIAEFVPLPPPILANTNKSGATQRHVNIF